jgi:hypothetical protein
VWVAVIAVRVAVNLDAANTIKPESWSACSTYFLAMGGTDLAYDPTIAIASVLFASFPTTAVFEVIVVVAGHTIVRRVRGTHFRGNTVGTRT